MTHCSHINYDGFLLNDCFSIYRVILDRTAFTESNCPKWECSFVPNLVSDYQVRYHQHRLEPDTEKGRIDRFCLTIEITDRQNSAINGLIECHFWVKLIEHNQHQLMFEVITVSGTIDYYIKAVIQHMLQMIEYSASYRECVLGLEYEGVMS